MANYRVTFTVPMTYSVVIDPFDDFQDGDTEALWDWLESNDYLVEAATDRNWLDTDDTSIEVTDVQWEDD